MPWNPDPKWSGFNQPRFDEDPSGYFDWLEGYIIDPNDLVELPP
jgi:hypothetical protein